MDKSSELANIPVSTPADGVVKVVYGTLGSITNQVSEFNKIPAGGSVPCIKSHIGSYYEGFLVTRCNCTSCFGIPNK